MAGVAWLEGAGRWDETASGARFAPAGMPGVFDLAARDGCLRVRLEPLPGRAGVDVSVQPSVLVHAVERSARAAVIDPDAAAARVARAVAALADRHGLATVDGTSHTAGPGAASLPAGLGASSPTAGLDTLDHTSLASLAGAASLTAGLGAASFPVLGPPYRAGRAPLTEVPRWAAAALRQPDARRATQALFGPATTRRVVRALVRCLIGPEGGEHRPGSSDRHSGNDGHDGHDGHDGNGRHDGHDWHDGNGGRDGHDGHHAHDGHDGHDGHDDRHAAPSVRPVDLFRVAVAHCGAASLDGDRLADLLTQPGVAVDPAAGPDVDTIRRARRLFADLPADRLARWLIDVVRADRPAPAFEEMVHALAAVRGHLPARLPGRRDELVALCRSLTPIDPRGHPGGVDPLPPRRPATRRVAANQTSSQTTSGQTTSGQTTSGQTTSGRAASGQAGPNPTSSATTTSTATRRRARAEPPRLRPTRAGSGPTSRRPTARPPSHRNRAVPPTATLVTSPCTHRPLRHQRGRPRRRRPPDHCPDRPGLRPSTAPTSVGA
jgi:hypothetical protein